MNAVASNQIVKFVSNQQIIHRAILSNSFNIICEKITLNDQVCLVAKYYNKKNLEITHMDLDQINEYPQFHVKFHLIKLYQYYQYFL